MYFIFCFFFRSPTEVSFFQRKCHRRIKQHLHSLSDSEFDTIFFTFFPICPTAVYFFKRKCHRKKNIAKIQINHAAKAKKDTPCSEKIGQGSHARATPIKKQHAACK
jgi:hypothetical protein